MPIGPVEMLVVAFPGNKFSGDIAPALADLVKAGTIRIIDLAFVMKDEGGNVVAAELEEIGGDVGAAWQAIQDKVGDLISEEDLMMTGKALQNNSSALMLVWEDTWATKVADAMANAGGVVLTLERVPRDVMQAALEYAEAKS